MWCNQQKSCWKQAERVSSYCGMAERHLQPTTAAKYAEEVPVGKFHDKHALYLQDVVSTHP